jgi:hypothetical protein
MTEVNHAASQQPAGKITQIRASAVAWQKIQFAVLGFIGLCGVLKGTGTSGGPRSLQIVAAILIVLALIVAGYATFLVGRAAWPLYSADRAPGGQGLRTILPRVCPCASSWNAAWTSDRA